MKKGFTLLEMLVVLFLLSSVLVITLPKWRYLYDDNAARDKYTIKCAINSEKIFFTY
ncbi:type II secretion system GspH family protein [Pasteurella canis]|uniref:pilus assembly FimT family protein n=1 Tax=Pasteurella canis TaxID=753 RepID=UPI001D0F758A|nr:type II secretion system GspH family protein [Pasteurella canis]